MRAQFERLWPLLAGALLEHPGTYEKHHVWAEIEAGRAQLWPAPHSAVVTFIHVYPTGLKELRGWLAAGDVVEIQALEPIVSDWAKREGCSRFVLTGRRGWARALDGFREIAVFLNKEL